MKTADSGPICTCDKGSDGRGLCEIHSGDPWVKIEYLIDGVVKDFTWVQYDSRKATKEFFTYCKSKAIHEAHQQARKE